MSVARPTFDESWFRVAMLRPKLRPSVQCTRQHFRGQRWYVLRDAASNKFFRLDTPSYAFIGLLDGRRTADEAWAIACHTLGDDAPTQGEAIRLLGQLYTANLLRAGVEGADDAAALLRRHQQRVQRDTRYALLNVLFAKIPLFDPDRLLDRLTPFLGWLFTRGGLVLWLVLLYVGLTHVAGRADELWEQSTSVLALHNLPLLYAVGAVVKLLHEMGHGVACKRFARAEGTLGEVHTLGVMLLVFVPMPYVDASSAWALRSKWRRAAVGAAGMYVELLIAALAAIVWARSASGTTLHALAFDAMFTASVSTLLFNGNPLLRFDGYYILSDLFEAPNLAQRSREQVHYLAKWFLYGVRRITGPASSLAEATALAAYGVLSSIYRLVLAAGIVLFVADKLFFVGAVLAIATLVQCVMTPLARFAHYLASSPELARTRRRAVLITAVPVLALVACVGIVPVTEHGRAEGVLEPARITSVHAKVDGFLVDVLPTGTPIDQNDRARVLARSENDELLARRDRAAAQLKVLEAQYGAALASETAEVQSIREQMAAVRRELVQAEEDLAGLQVAAPTAGLWLCGDADRVRGRFVQRGELLGLVAKLDRLTLRVTADQFLGPRLVREVAAGDRVELRLRGEPETTLRGVVTRVLAAGQRELPSAALGMAGGGALPIASDAMREGDGTRSAEPFFEVQLELDGSASRSLRAGRRVVARFDLEPAPLLAQAWRRARQMLQERFHI